MSSREPAAAAAAREKNCGRGKLVVLVVWSRPSEIKQEKAVTGIGEAGRAAEWSKKGIVNMMIDYLTQKRN